MVEEEYLQNMTRQQAIDELRRLGVLIPFDDNLKLYHGRAVKEDDDEWKVEPQYQGAGYENIYRVPAFSTGSDKVAMGFAVKRAREQNDKINDIKEEIEWTRQYGNEQDLQSLKPKIEFQKWIIYREKGILKSDEELLKPFHPKIYRIVPAKQNKNIFENRFDISQLSQDDKRVYYAALKKIADISPTSALPVDFKDREEAALICKILNATKQKMSKDLVGAIDYEMVAVAKAIFIKLTDHPPKEKLFEDLVVVINTFNFLSHNPKDILNLYMDNKTDIEFKDWQKKKYPISHQAINRYMEVNDIIGETATFSMPRDSPYYESNPVNYVLFLSNLNQFNTEEAILDEKVKAYHKYCWLDAWIQNRGRLFSPDASNILSDPNEVEFMKSMRSLGKMNDYMKAKAGVWEGYTVGEHTEAVLRIYNKYFADEMPEDLQKTMRLAIFIHDLEKGKAGKNASPEVKQKERKEALDNLYSNFGVSENIAKLAEFIAIGSQKFTTDYYIHKNNAALDQLTEAGYVALFGTSDPLSYRDDEAISALMKCCLVMQTCDSASYTTNWGIIRHESVYYRGGNDKWNESFEPDADKPVLIDPKEQENNLGISRTF